MTTTAATRPRKCKHCKQEFIPRTSLHTVCGYSCVVGLADAAKAKQARIEARQARKALRERKEQAKTRGQWQAEAQQAFNAYIRERDFDEPCISCGRWHQGQWHAGHYLSVGARPNLRFDEANCHKQCSVCNNHLHGNLVNYRRRLIEKIGVDAVEGLEADQSTKKYTIEDLKAIKADYTRKRRELEKERSE